MIILAFNSIYNFASDLMLTYFTLQIYQDSGDDVFSHVDVKFVNKLSNNEYNILFKTLYLHTLYLYMSVFGYTADKLLKFQESVRLECVF